MKLDTKTGSIIGNDEILGNFDNLLGSGKNWVKTADYIESAIPEIIGQKYSFSESENTFEDLKATPISEAVSAGNSEFCVCGNSEIAFDVSESLSNIGDAFYVSCALSVPGNLQGIYNKTKKAFTSLYLDGQMLPGVNWSFSLNLGVMPFVSISKDGMYLKVSEIDFSENLRGKEERSEIIVQTEYRVKELDVSGKPVFSRKIEVTLGDVYAKEDTVSELPEFKLSLGPENGLILPGIRIHHLSAQKSKPSIAGIFGKKVRYLDARGLKTAWNLQKEWISEKISENVSLSDKEKWNAKSDFSGSYDDLTDKPNLKAVATSGNYNDLSSKPNLSAVALSGNYNDLINKPSSVTIPENVSAFVNDSQYATEGFVSQKIENLVNYAPEALDTLKELSDALGNDPNFASSVSAEIGKKANTEELSAVAFSGSYSDLSGKPDLKTVALSGSYSDLTDVPLLKNVALSGSYSDLSDVPELADVALSGSYSDLTGTPILSAVALSGKYSDLSGKPDLKTVATSGSYSDLTGKPNLANIATSGNYDDLINVPAEFKPSEHNHDSRYYTSYEMTTKLAEKSDISHNHDEKYLGISAKAESAKSADSVAWNNVSGKPSTYTPSGHTHDDRYYTETEIDTKLSGKSDTSHNHNSAYLGISAKAESAKSADSVAWANVSGKPSSFTPSGHTHDDRYYTETEVNNLLAGKSNTNHTHSYISTSASCNKNWNWSGQGGQPSWLWGGNDGTNMYVYNPSNFSVNYANSAGSASSAGYASEAGHGNLLATYADDGHYLCPDRYDGWNTRLYMTYGDKSVKANNVHVYYADISGSATYASRSANNGGFYISGYLVTIE